MVQENNELRSGGLGLIWFVRSTMPKFTITITDKQLLHLINLLWLDINPHATDYDKANAFTIRLANKLAKAYKTS